MKYYKLDLVESREIGSRTLLINPCNGGWMLLAPDEAELLKKLDGNTSLQALSDQYPQFDLLQISRLVRKAERQGLLGGYVLHRCSSDQICGQKPYVAVINLTEQCNLECEYCYVDATCTRTNTMTAETACRIVDEMVEVTKGTGIAPLIILHGGEPLLNWDTLVAVVEYAESLPEEVLFNTQTNATLLTEEKAVYCREHHIAVGVSIDGPERLHDSVRYARGRKPSHSKTVQGIANLHGAGEDVSTISVISARNYEHTPEMIEHFMELGIRSFAFSQIFPTGRSNRHQDLFLTGQELFRAYKKTVDYIIEYNSVHSNPGEMLQERTLKYLSEGIFKKEKNYMCMRTPCGAGLNTLGFSTDGKVYACDNLIGNSDFYLGNIYEKSLTDILADNQLIHQLCSRKIEDMAHCADCIWRALCGGLCLSQTCDATEEMMEHHPVCEFRKLMIPYLMELYGENPRVLQLLDRSMSEQVTNIYSFKFYDPDLADPILDADTFSSQLILYHAGLGDLLYMHRLDALPEEELQSVIYEAQQIRGTIIACIEEDTLPEISFLQTLLEANVDYLQITIPLRDTKCVSIREMLEKIQKIRCRSGSDSRLRIKLIIPSEADTNRMPEDSSWIFGGLRNTDEVLIDCDLSAPNLFTGMKKNVNTVLDEIREMDQERFVQLGNTPPCLLVNENGYFLPEEEEQLPENMYSFAPDRLGGWQEETEAAFITEKCQSCRYLHRCETKGTYK